MSDKLVAGIITAAVISPICVVCILGPAAIGTLFAGAFGWIGGFGPLATIALMIAAGALLYNHFRRKRVQALPDREEYSDAESRAAHARSDWNRISDSRRDVGRG